MEVTPAVALRVSTASAHVVPAAKPASDRGVLMQSTALVPVDVGLPVRYGMVQPTESDVLRDVERYWSWLSSIKSAVSSNPDSGWRALVQSCYELPAPSAKDPPERTLEEVAAVLEVIAKKPIPTDGRDAAVRFARTTCAIPALVREFEALKDEYEAAKANGKAGWMSRTFGGGKARVKTFKDIERDVLAKMRTIVGRCQSAQSDYYAIGQQAAQYRQSIEIMPAAATTARNAVIQKASGYCVQQRGALQAFKNELSSRARDWFMNRANAGSGDYARTFLTTHAESWITRLTAIGIQLEATPSDIADTIGKSTLDVVRFPTEGLTPPNPEGMRDADCVKEAYRWTQSLLDMLDSPIEALNTRHNALQSEFTANGANIQRWGQVEYDIVRTAIIKDAAERLIELSAQAA